MLFQSDPDRFNAMVANDDPQTRYAPTDSIEDILLCEIIRYGKLNRQEMIEPLRQLYRRLAIQISDDARFSIYSHVAGFVQHTSLVSTNAFLPFIVEDVAQKIVSTAVIDYVSLSPISDDDPMSRVKDVIAMIERGWPQNLGAAFGGLLHLGDQRVCDLLRPLQDSLDHEALTNAIKSGTGFMYSATAEFYLDWLEGLEGDDQDGKFGLVAAGLGFLKRKSQVDLVFSGPRPFPVPKDWTSLGSP